MHKVEESLLHDVTVALTDCVISHLGDIRDWIVSFALTTSGAFEHVSGYGRINAIDICVDLVARLLVPPA